MQRQLPILLLFICIYKVVMLRHARLQLLQGRKIVCGYDVCATNDFNSNGCQEVTNGNTGDKTLTDGGYATYLGLSNYSGNTINCSIGWAFIPYQCTVDGSGNNIFGQWMQQNQMKVMLTEFGGSDDRSTTGDCVQDTKWMLQYMQDNAYNSSAPQDGGFIGWAAWRANRNGNWGSGQFDFLQQADQTVYGAPAEGTTGIVQGPGNGLMADVFASYLTQPSAGK